MADFSDRLRQLRKEKELSQQEVADALGFDKMTISGYENRKRHPRFDTIDTLADFLDVDINYLLGSSDQRRPYPPDDSRRAGQARCGSRHRGDHDGRARPCASV